MMKYENVIKIRAFEELILDLFAQNKLSGTTHTYIGEEATAVAIMNYVTDKDFIFSNHRCHGHYLAYGGPEELLLAEIMSKKSGLCKGKGGSQHIHYKNFYTNGVQGGIVPNAVGIALGNKLKNSSSNTLVFLGDGTLGQGVVYESLNIASIYEVPVMFIIEDNQYAMSTKRTDAIAGNIKRRIEGFDVKTFEIESTDVDELELFFKNAFDYINVNRKPVCAVIHNYRLAAHSKGDDTRPPEEIAEHKKNDPINFIIAKLGQDKTQEIYNHFRASFENIVSSLEQENSITVDIPKTQLATSNSSLISTTEVKCIESIREGLKDILEQNDNIVLIGEDIRDPYGGAFKATKGLSYIFDQKILNMPISEACMIGLSIGLALNGFIPITEMMFGDFITLGFDQLLNHASKYGWVYGVSVPMIIRVPSGAKRGYGPTHSQSLEKFLVGIPCIKVLALSCILNAHAFYKQLVNAIQEPTVVIENKMLYGQKLWKIVNGRYRDFTVKEINHYGYPTFIFSLDSDTPDAYIITYGGSVADAIQASEELMMQFELQIDIIVLSQLSPIPILDLKGISDVPIFTVEEGTYTAGIGAELISVFAENKLGKTFHRIATPDIPIPNGIVLENQIIPNKDIIMKRIKEILE